MFSFFKKSQPTVIRGVDAETIVLSEEQRSWNDSDYLLAYTQNEWVYSACKVKAEATAQATLRLFQKKTGGQKDEVHDHPCLDLLNHPTSYLTRYELFEFISIYLDLVGQAYLFINKESGEILPLIPTKVEPIKDPKNFIRGYLYMTPNGQRITFTEEEILHFRESNPADFYSGASPLKAAARSFDSDLEASKWNYNFFKNSAKPTGILGFGGTNMSDDIFERLKRKFIKDYQGTKSAHKLSILRQTPDFIDLSGTEKDIEFERMGDVAMRKILASFRVPKSVLGVVEDVNRANAEASEYTFQKNTVLPRLRRIEERLNLDFLKLWGIEKTHFFRFDDPTPENTDLKIRVRESNARIGATTINELRTEDGLDPLEGGDVPLVSFGLVPLDQVGQDTTAPAGTKSFEETGLIQSEAKIIDIYLKRFTRNEKSLATNLKGFFEDLKKDVLANISTNLKKGVKTKGVEDLLFDKEHSEHNFRQIFAPLFMAIALDEGKSALAELGSKLILAPTPSLKSAITKQTNMSASQVVATSYDKIKKVLLEELEAGEGEIDMAQRLREKVTEAFDIDERFRSAMIARTETLRASSVGHLEGYTQMGVKKIKWRTITDGREREDHKKADGQVQPIGEDFHVGGENLKSPGVCGTGGCSAGNVVNCRCRVFAVQES